MWTLRLVSICIGLLPSIGQDLTASLTGKVLDRAGAAVPGAIVELRSPVKEFLTRTDSDGVYRFAGLPADEYTLKISLPYFKTLTIKSIHLSEGEEKSIPVLNLALGGMCWNEYIPSPAYYQLLSSGGRGGTLAGSVVVEPGPTASGIHRVSGAEVSLICANGSVCRKTKTDSKGAFVFMGLPPGEFTLRVDHVGFYPVTGPSYRVVEGMESIYSPISIERCHLGNCDLTLRPKKPLSVCE